MQVNQSECHTSKGNLEEIGIYGRIILKWFTEDKGFRI
jgi:hypothetical protein